MELGIQEQTAPLPDAATQLVALCALGRAVMTHGIQKFLARCQAMDMSALSKDDAAYLAECYVRLVLHSYRAAGAYHMPVEACPYCGHLCYADWVDVGVGLVQCGPYHCDCGASEIGPHDKPRTLAAVETETGWYAPGTPPGSSANVVDGKIVDWETAQDTYRALYPLSATEAGQALIRGV